MKRRLMIGLLTVGMIAQSLSVPVMASSTDLVNEEFAEEPLSEEPLSEEPLSEEPKEDPSDGMPAESEIEYDDVSDVVYQAGAFSVLGESTDEKYAPYSVISYAAASNMAQAEEYLFEQLKARAADIDLSAYNIPLDDRRALYSGVLNEHPDLYYVSTGFSYYKSGDILTRILPKYIDNLDDSAFQAGLQRALSVVYDGMSDLEAAVALHDYLAVNCEYDKIRLADGTIPLTSYSAYGVLADRIAVCQGYALAYKYLLNLVGIDCYMVTSESMNHAWNLIVLNGEYYQVDVTWDDPTWDRIGRVVHTYMFRSDAAFAGHSGWKVTSGSETIDCIAVDTRYDSAFWTNCSSPLVLTEDGCYYVAYENSTVNLKKKTSLEDVADTGTTILNIGRWPVWGGGGLWQGAYSGLFMMDGRLYYNDTTCIYSVALDGTDIRTEFTADTTDGYLYGIALRQHQVLYCLHQTPNLTGKETVLIADMDVIVEDDDQSDFFIVWSPTVTTYKVGQPIDLTGGKVTLVSGGIARTVPCTLDMINGFDSTTPGVCKVTVVYEGYESSFDTLIVEEPELTAWLGQKLGEVDFPENEYGTYSWADGEQELNTIGLQTFDATYTPFDANAFQKLTDLEIQVTVRTELGDTTVVEFKDSKFVYNGTEQEPEVVVSLLGNELAEGQDYTLSYQNNINAGEATVIVNGINDYLGGVVVQTFQIDPAQLTITAQDMVILAGEPIPETYDYVVSGLVPGEELLTHPSFTCDVAYKEIEGNEKVAKAGRYDIIPHDADAGDNYEIEYVNGTLTVEVVSYTVIFDLQGLGTNLTDTVEAGNTVSRPDPDPSAEGYRFDGWYQDAACTDAWDFDTDVVQSDLTLYAGWTQVSEESDGNGDNNGNGDNIDNDDNNGNGDNNGNDNGNGDNNENDNNDENDDDIVGGLAFSEISDVYYTGKASKPAVSVYDGKTLLKAGKDYQVKYYNNTNANKDNILKKGDGTGTDFIAELPYVEIIGIGNYTEVVKVNFNIRQASIGDGSEDPASGITLKVSDQLVTANKVQTPFTSIKYVKSMKPGTDYTLSLTAVNARDLAGRSLPQGSALRNAEIPAGYEGEFLLTVQGTGNYEGSICKAIHVADRAHLIKNATVTLGKNLKNVPYTGKKVELPSSAASSADTFTVKSGNVPLEENKDYTVSYRNNDRVGTAALIITGVGEYAGSKTVTFHIKGKALTAKKVNVQGIENKVYNGKEWTQNGVILTYSDGTEGSKTLKYGTDYSISYSKNVNKGTATMTFHGVDTAGYSGSFKKTFKITAQDISDESKVTQSAGMRNITAGYTKAGAKPVDEIVLTNSAGVKLTYGSDYTLKYANNKAVAGKTDRKPPTITVMGKGNYTGELKVYFTIAKGDLDWEADTTNITVKASPVGYQMNKAADYAYKPSIKLMDGKTALRAGTDYEIVYENNTQADYETFMQKVKNDENYMQNIQRGTVSYDSVPRAVITGKADSNYRLNGSKTIILPIYQTKLTKSNLSVQIGEAVYTGSQVRPEVTVYYQGEGGRIKLIEGNDYSISYGTNIQSGKNKGSITISGMAPHYGGDVTVKFKIVKRSIVY